MPIAFKDLLSGHVINDVPINTQQKLESLKNKLNALEKIYDDKFVVTSGYRSEQDQKRINPKNMKSNHLLGQAADIADVTGKLKHWILSNVVELEKLDLYCEDFAHTPTWVHFQTVPPKSGKRFFIP